MTGIDISHYPDWAHIQCPGNCYAHYPNNETQYCVCPTQKGVKTLPSTSNCDPTIELCEDVVAIRAKLGFKYRPNAEMIFALIGAALVGYGTYLTLPIDLSTQWGAAWFYNFSATLFTWGVEVLFWIVSLLFRSDGGTVDNLFAFWTRLCAFNVYFFYWIVDVLILLGLMQYGLTAPSDKVATWIKFGGLFLMQAGASIVQLLMKDSIFFDVNWARAAPEVFDAQTGGSLSVDDDFTPINNGPTMNTMTEQEIVDYWGF